MAAAEQLAEAADSPIPRRLWAVAQTTVSPLLAATVLAAAPPLLVHRPLAAPQIREPSLRACGLPLAAPEPSVAPAVPVSPAAAAVAAAHPTARQTMPEQAAAAAVPAAQAAAAAQAAQRAEHQLRCSFAAQPQP